MRKFRRKNGKLMRKFREKMEMMQKNENFAKNKKSNAKF